MPLLRLPLVVLLVSPLLACSEMRNSTGMVSKRIGEVVHTPGAAELDLRRLTSFGWDYFYATKPGVTREEVCKLINAGRSTCGRIIRIERAPDDHVYLLFGQAGNLTHVELHAVKNGVFDVPFTDGGHPKEQSVFRIRRSSTSGEADSILLEAK
jgi:hypothetical protein